MDACLRRAGPRAAALLQDAEREHSEFYQLLKTLAQKGSSGNAPSSFDPAASPPSSPFPPKALPRTDGARPLDCSSDDGDLFSRDGSGDDSSSGGSDISCRDFHVSLHDTSSSDADSLVAFARACSVMSATWRCEAAAHANELLQRMCSHAREMAEASCSSSRGWGAAAAAAAYTSHVCRVSHMLLPHTHLPSADFLHMPSRHQEHGRGGGFRSAEIADDEQVHLARWSRAARLNENAHSRQDQNQQHHQQHESSLRLMWMNVWRSCR